MPKQRRSAAAAAHAEAAPHRQRRPHCCRTHWSAGPFSGQPAVDAVKQCGCWDCASLAMADTVLGLAELFGWGGCGLSHTLAGHGSARSVLDCLVAAEEELLRRRPWHTHQARPGRL